VALEVLNVGSDHAIEVMPGAHAGVQIGNNQRPTFYLRGVTPAQLYLVRAVTKVEHRELIMPISRNFQEWARYRAKDVTNMELQSVTVDVMTVKPLADLKPGEYVLASAFEPGAYWIRLGYDFGLIAGSTEYKAQRTSRPRTANLKATRAPEVRQIEDSQVRRPCREKFTSATRHRIFVALLLPGSNVGDHVGGGAGGAWDWFHLAYAVGDSLRQVVVARRLNVSGL
jgi:hypothetical protein